MPDKDNYGITVLYSPADGQALNCRTVFDLVAIHGLNGDAFDTWYHKQTGTMWLRDLLPGALPNVRIMTFGYNARFKNFTAQQDLRSIASKLLAELVDLRTTKEQKSRPIVLICHSLGGIVAKKALLIGCPIEQETVQNAVYGILFLGTPHNGSSLATLGKLVANIVSACSPINPARSLVATLQKDSAVLFEITEDFVKRRKMLHLVSFFEMEMTSIAPFLKKFVVEQHSAILNLPDEITIGQYSDHRDIVRFKSIHDRNFRPVLFRLKKFEGDITEQVHQKASETSSVASSATKESAIPLDIPILPCSSFRGRTDVLDKMRTHFYGAEAKSHSRRSFAICGLGGSGKTQTALRFMFQNLSRYDHGVMFLNATSKVSITTEFSRLHELLGLRETDDKIASVKRWLSREEHSRWLMVFDNADDSLSVPISKYFPVVSWGHIVITSRDQAVLGGVAQEGCILGPLASDEAKSVLLETAGIRQPSSDDLEIANDIVKLLGYLPIALGQAGALMRSRHKSPKEYRDLYLRERLGVLQFKPRIGDSEGTVLTAWEVNFMQIESESKDAADLLLLFCFLEPSAIAEAVLYRGSSSRKRWDENGEVTEVSAEAEGLDSNLANLIQNEMEFDAAIEKLLSVSLVSCNKETNGLRNFSVHPLVQYCAMQRISLETANIWRWQAIYLICHAFPRSRYIEPLNGEIGRNMLPQLSHVLREYDQMCADPHGMPPVQHELAATILAASRFSDTAWKIEVIARAKQLLKDDSYRYMNAWLTYRESAVLRMCGKLEESNGALREFLQSRVLPDHDQRSEVTSRYNAQRGDLIISFSENMIRQGNLEEAKNELCEWSPLDPTAPSTLERITLRARDINLGKILRYQGHFEEALASLSLVLEESQIDDFFEGTGWYRVLLSGIADLYCEVGRPQDAEKLLQRELEPMMEKGTQDIATGRRLRLSLAETFIERDMFDFAEEVLLRLKDVYEAVKKRDYATDIGFFRVLVGLARVSHRQARWDEALSYWARALSTAERLNMTNGFEAGLVRYSIAHVLLMTGHGAQSHVILAEAIQNVASDQRMFWIAGFNSGWHDYIIGRLDKEVMDKL